MEDIQKAIYSDEKSHQNEIEITVKYVLGDYADVFNKHQTILHVFEKAIKNFQIDQHAASKLALFLNGSVLNNNLTIEESGLQNKTYLILSSIKSEDVEG